jgi:hypothetical protein
MPYYKRALTAYQRYAVSLVRWLGLFFCFCISLGAQENSVSIAGDFSSAAGTLWVADDGAAAYWHSGLMLGPGRGGPSPHDFTLTGSSPVFSLGFDVGQVFSSLPLLNGSVFGFGGQCGIYTPRGGFTAAYGFFNQSPVQAAAQETVITSDGGQGYFFGFEAPLRFGIISIVPHFLYGAASWEDGEMYWFFGKPDIPSLLIYGLDISFYHYGEQSRYKHGPGFRALNADINIISNENDSLFDTGLNAGLFWYQCSLEKNQCALTGTLGWLYADASLEGALTSSNQPYFLFPYRFSNVDACLKTHAGFAALRFRYRQGIFQYHVDLGAFHIFYNRGDAEVHYQKKNLFGGEEGFEKVNPEISGLGAAVLLLEAGIPALPLGGKRRLALSLQKAFILPWGYEKLISSGGGAGGGKPSGDETLSLIKTILLSGLSIRGSLKW